MSTHGFGQERPAPHVDAPHRAPARYLVIIDSAGVTLARLFLASREQVAEFDAGSEEVALMTHGLTSIDGASGPEWDQALAGHNPDERGAAKVYALEV